jgi:hypothetical protein
MSTHAIDRFDDRAWLQECIEAQRCPWCDRAGLRSLSNHTVLAHRIYAGELRDLAGLPPDAPLCSPELSDQHRRLAREQDKQWLRRPEVLAAAAATREANYDPEQRRRRRQQLDSVRRKALEVLRRSVQAERRDPALAAKRRIARSKAHRALREGAECPICGAWFCSFCPPGQDYRQPRYCSGPCRGEAFRRLRRRDLARRTLERVTKRPRLRKGN